MENKLDIKAQLPDSKECCGCMACYDKCAKNAIAIIKDEFGFQYPQINSDLCINCGSCLKTCPIIAERENNIFPQQAYAARHKKLSEIKTSRSGAAFIALAETILEKGGIVYGAKLIQVDKVAHVRATTLQEIQQLKGSKYIQSETQGIYKKAKEDLSQNKIVLFSGTACQIQALKQYLGKRTYDNLITCDIICHGVGSPKIWSDYLVWTEKNESQKIKQVNFRDKDYLGWSDHRESFILFDGKKKRKQLFSALFVSGLCVRENCFSCKFCNTHRPGDITLGDLWGWEKVVPKMNVDNWGISLCIINSEKGLSLFNEAKERLTYKSISLSEVLQPRLKGPMKMSQKYPIFKTEYITEGFHFVVDKYAVDHRSKIRKLKERLQWYKEEFKNGRAFHWWWIKNQIPRTF